MLFVHATQQKNASNLFAFWKIDRISLHCVYPPIILIAFSLQKARLESNSMKNDSTFS